MFSAALRVLATTTFAVAIGGAASAGAPPAALAAARAPGAAAQPSQTVTDLTNSMHSQALDAATYDLYATRALDDGLPGVARLFRVAAQQKRNSFVAETALAGLVGSDEANLRNALASAQRGARVRFPALAKQAARAGDKAAAAALRRVAGTERAARKGFLTALHVLQGGRGTVPVPPAVTAARLPAARQHMRSAKLLAALSTAMRDQAYSAALYGAYAQHARRYGDLALARLFDGYARQDLRADFATEAAQGGFIGSTQADLAKAIANERAEAQTMYPAMAGRAAQAGNAVALAVYRRAGVAAAANVLAFQLSLRKVRVFRALGG